MDPDDPHLTPDAQAEEILRRAEADALARQPPPPPPPPEVVHEAIVWIERGRKPPPPKPWKHPWWYRGFTGRHFDWLDAFAIAVIISTVLLVILGAAGAL